MMEAVQDASLWPIWIYVLLGIFGVSGVAGVIVKPRELGFWIVFLIVACLLGYQFYVGSDAGLPLKRVYVTAACILGLGVFSRKSITEDPPADDAPTTGSDAAGGPPETHGNRSAGAGGSSESYDSIIFGLTKTTPPIDYELSNIYQLDKKLSAMAAKGMNPLMGEFAETIEEIEKRQDAIAEKIASLHPVDNVEKLALYISENIDKWGDRLVFVRGSFSKRNISFESLRKSAAQEPSVENPSSSDPDDEIFPDR